MSLRGRYFTRFAISWTIVIDRHPHLRLSVPHYFLLSGAFASYYLGNFEFRQGVLNFLRRVRRRITRIYISTHGTYLCGTRNYIHPPIKTLHQYIRTFLADRTWGKLPTGLNFQERSR
jgi:hypothetical protein